MRAPRAKWSCEPLQSAELRNVWDMETSGTPEGTRDLYQCLGVPRDASLTELRAAFRERARALHPDRQAGDAGAFARVEHAYRVLTHPEKRRLYDLLLDAGIVSSTSESEPVTPSALRDAGSLSDASVEAEAAAK